MLFEVSDKRSGTGAGPIRVLLRAPIEVYTKLLLNGPAERLLGRNANWVPQKCRLR